MAFSRLLALHNDERNASRFSWERPNLEQLPERRGRRLAPWSF